MAMSRERLRELAQEMAKHMGIEAKPTPQLRLVGNPVESSRPRRFDSITRASHIDRIRYLSRGYGLNWLIEQATFDRPGLDSLDDDELIQLHRDMDKAMDCIRDGVAFEDADLVRRLSQEGDFYDEMDDFGDPDVRLAG